jgi:hypothetical protein
LQVPNCPFYQFQYFWWLCWCLAHLCCTFAVCFVDKDWRFPVPWDPPVIEEAVAIWGNSRLLQVSTTAEMHQVFFTADLSIVIWIHCYYPCRGNGASVLRIVPYAALHYMTYEQYRCWILNNFAPSIGTGPVVDLLAGSAAGGTAVLCTYPLDLARTKLAYQVLYYHVHWCNFLFILFLWL